MDDSPPTGRPHETPVPVYLSSFVGRRAELAQLRELLGRDDLRLLTLTGPGGSGKTRLASQLARDAAGAFEDGLCWVALEGLTNAAQLPQAVVSALGLVEVGASPVELLGRVLARRQMLLVLDNCEHLLAACAQLAAALLGAAPDLRLLATSRERLNIAGEHVWPVPGLSIPAGGEPGGKALPPPPEKFLDFDSVRLFVERAAAVAPAFRLTEANAPLVGRVCRQVDGLPLAVELAAARSQVLGVEQIVERLGQRLDLPGRGPHAAPDRHKTLRATFDWSHEQLAAGEKVLFRRLGVFQGRFSLSAVESVAGPRPGGDPAAAWPALAPEAILDVLSGLVEKSLVSVERPGAGRTVFRLLDMVRRYAHEKLDEAGEAEAARENHLAYYAGLAATAEPGLKGRDQRLWVQRLELAHDNLRAALGWAIQRAQATGADRYRLVAQHMANSLFWFWNAADRFGEARDWLERALALFQPRPLEPAVAEGLRVAGTLAWLLGDMDAAWRHFEASYDLYRRLGDDRGAAHATMMFGRVMLYRGRPGPAVRYLAESAASLQALGAVFERGLALGALSAAQAMAGDYDQAYASAAECRDIFQAVGDPFFLGMALGDMGWAAYHQGNLPAATGHLREALDLRRRIDSQWQVAQALIYLAEISRFEGQTAAALGYLEEARALAEDLGALGWLALSTRHLGLLSANAGRWTEATAHLLESLAAANQMDDRAGAVMALEGLAAAAASADDAAAPVDNRALAGVLFGAAEQAREEIGPPRTPAERSDREAVVRRLSPWFDDGRFREGRVAGRGMSLVAAARRAEPLAWAFDAGPIATARTAHPLQVLALGPPEVLVDGRRLVAADWGYAKPKELFFYLIAHPPRTKEQIGLDFWPDAAPDQLRRNFRSTLYHLRQALGDREWILFADGRYSFNRARDYWYDVEAFERELAAGRAAAEPAAAIDALAAAARLYRGDFLAGLGLDEWASGRRAALRQAFLEAQERRAELLLAAGRAREATGLFRDLLDADNLMESAHRGLMRGLVQLGRRDQALRHYGTLVDLLAGELGAPPDPATAALYRRILSGE